jgi:hypothetical protein
MPSFIDHAHDEEQRPGADPVVHHLQDPPFDPLGIEREEAQHHKSEVTHRGESHQLLDVSLRVRNSRPIQDPDHRQQRDPGGKTHGRLGEEREIEAQEAVGPHLQEHPGQNHRAGRRRLDMGVGQPGVQGPHGHLDGECGGEGEKQPGLRP